MNTEEDEINRREKLGVVDTEPDAKAYADLGVAIGESMRGIKNGLPSKCCEGAKMLVVHRQDGQYDPPRDQNWAEHPEPAPVHVIR